MSNNVIEKTCLELDMVVISGGGIKGIAFIGALSGLQKKTFFRTENLKFLSGSSIGGVICTAICLGYSVEEMKDWFLSTDFELSCPELYDKNNTKKILPFINNCYSLGDGMIIEQMLTEIFLNKNISPQITFEELLKKTGKTLVLSGSNISKNKCDYFSIYKTPTMEVLKALFITTRIPYLFPYIKLNDDIYVDGHIFDPFPIKGFPKKIIKESKGKILGIMSSSLHNENNINDIKDYTFSIINGLSLQYLKKSTKRYKKYIIDVKLENDFFTLQTNTQQLLSMFEKGKNTALNFLP